MRETNGASLSFHCGVKELIMMVSKKEQYDDNIVEESESEIQTNAANLFPGKLTGSYTLHLPLDLECFVLSAPT